MAGVLPCGAIGVLSRGPCGVRPELGEGPAFRFVLVSLLRGRCPWLSVRSSGWEPAGHGHMAAPRQTLPGNRLHKSDGILRCRQERTVKTAPFDLLPPAGWPAPFRAGPTCALEWLIWAPASDARTRQPPAQSRQAGWGQS